MQNTTITSIMIINLLDFVGSWMLYTKVFLMMRILMNTHTRTDIYIFALRCKDWVCGIQFKVLLSHYLTTNSCAQKIVTCHTQVVFWLVTVLKRRRIFVHLNMPQKQAYFWTDTLTNCIVNWIIAKLTVTNCIYAVTDISFNFYRSSITSLYL